VRFHAARPSSRFDHAANARAARDRDKSERVGPATPEGHVLR